VHFLLAHSSRASRIINTDGGRITEALFLEFERVYRITSRSLISASHTFLHMLLPPSAVAGRRDPNSTVADTIRLECTEVENGVAGRVVAELMFKKV
jgi:hypothetical protein